jgi:HAD superfamily hydrolase (TIGR01509 family)
MGADKLLPQLTGIDAKSEQGKALVERRKAIFAKEYLPSVRRFPKARELLERMRDDGLRLVVATSASEDELHGLLDTLGADWLLDDKTTSSDAKRSKPDPDIVRVALDKAGASPDRCVMLGDTSYDVEAATKSGVKVVAVRCGGSGDDDLRGAAEIYDDPAQVLERYAETLIGRGVSGVKGSEGRRGSAFGRTGEEESHGNAV